MGYPIIAVHVPKTVDNDLPVTDTCPGFGSVAKYVATSMMEAVLDVESMAKTSTKVFILEVMGRHAGWITAATGLAQRGPGMGPHILLFPEIAWNEEAFLARVEEMVKRYGYCAVGASEGLQDKDGRFLSESGLKDAFGHSQLGGVAPMLSRGSSSSSTGPSPTTCSAPRATSPRRPTSISPTRSARPRWSSR
jgi:6-phosphofructokinase 1